MGFIRRFLPFVLVLGLFGCSQTVVSSFFGNEREEIPLKKIDENLLKKMPITKKDSFGTVKIVSVSNQAPMNGRGIEVVTRFILTSFEIPEGIDGTVISRSGLRYEAPQRTIYYHEINATRLAFGNASLEEYVSASARQAIPQLVSDTLGSLPLYRMDSAFTKSRIRHFRVEKGKLLLEFAP